MPEQIQESDALPGEGAAAERDLILELNFVPDWARKPPETSRFAGAPGPSRSPERSGARIRDRGRREAGPRRGPARDRGAEPRGRPSRETAPAEDRDRSPLPVAIRILPEQKQVSAVARQLHATSRSYPLAQVAGLFVGKPAACYFRIELGKEAAHVRLFQCRLCQTVALDRSHLVSHLLGRHVGEYFTREQTEADPPKGNFVCVARCGLSGTLLGPPNHHSYEERLQELRSARFPNVPLAEYRQRIEIVREPDLIERWKEECRKQTVYRRKDGQGQDSPPVRWAAAADFMEKEAAPALIAQTRSASVPCAIAMDTEDPDLRREIRRAWEMEKRFPRSILFALRAAFRHKKLHLFHVGRVAEFVTAVRPLPLDPTHAVENIREVLLHLRSHPGATRRTLLETLRPGQAPDSDGAAQVLSPLGWLAARGHIIEFFDGTLAVPLAESG
jgi:hypothetical protein